MCKHFPQLGKLDDVLHRKALLSVYLEDPKTILHCHLHRTPSFLCNSKDFRSSILRTHTLSQIDFRNKAFSPLLDETFVAATKRSQSFGVQGFPSPIQGLRSSVHSFHSDCNLKAEANFLRLITPRPPNSSVLQTCSQITLHFPLVTFHTCRPKKGPYNAIFMATSIGELASLTCEVF
jgi:hypothetical protein